MKTFFWILLAAGAINLAATAQPTNAMNTNHLETATLGGGCFWCMVSHAVKTPVKQHIYGI